MNFSEIIVLIFGSALIFVVLFYFFGPKKKAKVQEKSGQQEIDIVVQGGYSPSQIEVKKGIPVKINFDRRESGECSEWVIFEKLGIKKRLPVFSTTSLEFTPTEEGEFPFICGMGMLHGKLVVKD
jgi:Cu+-exporting ATPase